MKILVTGGAGYKGIVLVKELLELKHDVTIIDNFMYGYSSILHLISNKNLTINQLDIRNIKENDVSGFDVIYHLAGISGMPACSANPNSAEIINVESTRKMVDFMHKDQILIYASTTSFYGDTGAVCDEDSNINAVSIYGKTKYEAEKIIQQRENSISLRFATVFGVSPKMRNDLLLNDFVYKSIKEKSIVIFAGHTKRTFIHIEDAVNAYLFALENNEKMKGNVYNVGDYALNFSKNDIADCISKYTTMEIVNSKLPDKDVRDFIISYDKINKLGYCTKRDLDYGILELIKLYKFYSYNLSYNII